MSDCQKGGLIFDTVSVAVYCLWKYVVFVSQYLIQLLAVLVIVCVSNPWGLSLVIPQELKRDQETGNS